MRRGKARRGEDIQMKCTLQTGGMLHPTMCDNDSVPSKELCDMARGRGFRGCRCNGSTSSIDVKVCKPDDEFRQKYRGLFQESEGNGK